MKEISIVIPSIRTANWENLLKSLAQSCQMYSYEVVFVGPFDPPAEISQENVRFIKTYRCPSAALQLGCQAAQGKLLCHSVDDAKFVPKALDQAVDFYKRNCGYKDVVNLRYTEDIDYSGKTFPREFWGVRYHKNLRLRGIPQEYKISLHFLIDLTYFIEMGGVDCQYEYLNFNLHDLMFRIQYNGGKLFDSPSDVTHCNYYPKRSVDHGPIEDAYIHDFSLFQSKYKKKKALKDAPICIPVNNWKHCPEIWARRFPSKIFSTYEEMLEVK